MSEDQDRESKTEEPTEKKLHDAIDKGNVPQSREAITFGSLAAILLVLAVMLPKAVAKLVETLRLLFDNVGLIHLEVREDADFLIFAAGYHVAMAVFPLMAVVAAGSIIAALLQNMPQANSERIKPQASRISPFGGLKRIFGFAGFSEFAKSLIKLLAIGLITALMVRQELPHILSLYFAEPVTVPETVRLLTVKVLSALVLASLLLGGADIALSRFNWRRNLRMTRQEIKDEFKQAEGDPHIKSRIRQAARSRMSRQMMKKVPTATVVIANPTHFAVALRYVREEGGAPIVVAKGVDYLALRIRALAEEHTIPVIENKPLARALYDQAEVDQMIPPEFYKAVAEIIHFLQLRKSYASPVART